MEAVLITAYLIIVLALIAVILLQRSEGGALGIGGGNGGLMTVRGSANLLTRTTAILAALFFATAIGLTILTELNRASRGILDRADSVGTTTTSGTTSVLDALNSMQNDSGLAVPQAPANSTTPATTTETPATPAAPTDAAPAAPTEGGTAAPAEGQPAPSGTPAAPVN